jgi:hypothetical protein
MEDYIRAITRTHLVFILLMWYTKAIRNFDNAFIDCAYNQKRMCLYYMSTSATCIN